MSTSKYRILVVSIFSLFALAGEAVAAGRGRGGPPGKYEVTVSSDRDLYIQGMTSSFSVTVMRKIRGREFPVVMRGKQLIATFPDTGTEVTLTQKNKKHWSYEPFLDSPGEKTLTVDLYLDSAHAVTRIERQISRLERTISHLEAVRDRIHFPWFKRGLNRAIQVLKAIVARLQARLDELRQPLAQDAKTILVEPSIVISIVAPTDGACVRQTIDVLVSSNWQHDATVELLVDGALVDEKTIPGGDFAFVLDTTTVADGSRELKASLAPTGFPPETGALSEPIGVVVDNTPATYTWDGGGTTGSWHEAANWTYDTVPQPSDVPVFDGTSQKNCDVSAAMTVSGLEINDTYTGTICVSADATVAGDITQSGGLLVLTSSGTVNALGVYEKSGGTLRLDSADQIVKVGTLVVSGGSVDLTGGCIVEVCGDVDISGDNTFVPSDAVLRLVGNGPATISVGGANNIAGTELHIAKDDEVVVTVARDFQCGELNHDVGILDMNGRTVAALSNYKGTSGATLRMAVGELIVGAGISNHHCPWYVGDGWKAEISGGAITVYGNANATERTVWFDTGSKFEPSNDSFRLFGAHDIRVSVARDTDVDFTDLVVGDGTNAVTVTLANKDTGPSYLVRDALTISANATLNANGQRIYVGKAWINNGTFVAGQNEVTFIGASAFISGNTPFHELTCYGLSDLAVDAGSQVSVGELTLKGTSSQSLLRIRSSVPGSPWHLDLKGPAAVSLVDVQDSNASSGLTVYATDCVDSGNNTNWVFDAALKIAYIEPDEGRMQGGTEVRVNGVGFDDDTVISFDGIPATVREYGGENLIVVVTPEHAPGVVDVTAHTAAGSDTAANAFTYIYTVAAPTGLYVAKESTTIEAFWDIHPVQNIAGYDIYRKAENETDYAKLNTGGLLTTENYVDLGTDPAVRYWYAVKAVDVGSVESDFSRAATAPEVEVTTGGNSNISPACVEGSCSEGTTGILVTPDGQDTVSATLIAFTKWYANAPLESDDVTHLTIVASDEHGSTNMMQHQVTWSSIDVPLWSHITIRKGDYLLLTATGSGSLLEIDPGTGSWQNAGAPGDVLVAVFGAEGTYTVRSRIDGGSAAKMEVTVVSTDLRDSVACQIDFTRGLNINILPDGAADYVVLCAGDTADIEIILPLVPSTDPDWNARLYLKPKRPGIPHIVSRIGSTDGPVIASQEVDEFTLSTDSQFVSLRRDDEREGWKVGQAALTMDPLVPDLEVILTMREVGPTFDNGLPVMSVSTSEFRPLPSGAGVFSYVVCTPEGTDDWSHDISVVQHQSPDESVGSTDSMRWTWPYNWGKVLCDYGDNGELVEWQPGVPRLLLCRDWDRDHWGGGAGDNTIDAAFEEWPGEEGEFDFRLVKVEIYPELIMRWEQKFGDAIEKETASRDFRTVGFELGHHDVRDEPFVDAMYEEKKEGEPPPSPLKLWEMQQCIHGPYYTYHCFRIELPTGKANYHVQQRTGGPLAGEDLSLLLHFRIDQDVGPLGGPRSWKVWDRFETMSSFDYRRVAAAQPLVVLQAGPSQIEVQEAHLEDKDKNRTDHSYAVFSSTGTTRIPRLSLMAWPRTWHLTEWVSLVMCDAEGYHRARCLPLYMEKIWRPATEDYYYDVRPEHREALIEKAGDTQHWLGRFFNALATAWDVANLQGQDLEELFPFFGVERPTPELVVDYIESLLHEYDFESKGGAHNYDPMTFYVCPASALDQLHADTKTYTYVLTNNWGEEDARRVPGQPWVRLSLVEMEPCIPDEDNKPVTAKFIAASNPRPVVNIDDVVATLSGNQLTVDISGTIKDALCDIIPEDEWADIDIASDLKLVCGSEEWDVSSYSQDIEDSIPDSEKLWRPYPYIGTFTVSGTITVGGPGSYGFTVETGDNAVGNKGYQSVTVNIGSTAVAPGGWQIGTNTVHMDFEQTDPDGPVVSDSELLVPKYVAVDRGGSGRVYVTDARKVGSPQFNRHYIKVFTRDGTYLGTWPGVYSGSFSPTGMSVLPDESVLVLETTWQTGEHDRIVQYESDGDYLCTLDPYPDDPDGMWSLDNTSVSPAGFVYVVNGGTDRVIKFDFDVNASPGTFEQILSWGAPDVYGGSPFDYPTGIAVNPDETVPLGEAAVFVFNQADYRIHVFNWVGTWLRAIGDGPNDPFGLVGFDGLALSAGQGRLYAAELQRGVVVVDWDDGNDPFKYRWGDPQSEEDSEKQIAMSYSVASDEEGYVYVADCDNARIHKFKDLGDEGEFVKNWGHEDSLSLSIGGGAATDLAEHYETQAAQKFRGEIDDVEVTVRTEIDTAFDPGAVDSFSATIAYGEPVKTEYTATFTETGNDTNEFTAEIEVVEGTGGGTQLCLEPEEIHTASGPGTFTPIVLRVHVPDELEAEHDFATRHVSGPKICNLFRARPVPNDQGTWWELEALTFSRQKFYVRVPGTVLDDGLELKQGVHADNVQKKDDVVQKGEVRAEAWSEAADAQDGVADPSNPDPKCVGTYAMPMVKIDLDADSDRDGPVSRSQAEENAEDVHNDPGAVVFANTDDDDGDGEPDNADEVINGPDDKDDMARLVLELSATHLQDGEVSFIISDRSKVRVFDQNDSPVTFDTDGVAHPALSDFAGGPVEYLVEGIRSGTITFSLMYVREPWIDRVKMTVGVTVVMTFDDGPVGDAPLDSANQSTEQILDDLAANDIQDGIKGVFFLITHNEHKGGSSIGEGLIQREHNEGHVCAVHAGGQGVKEDGDHYSHEYRVGLSDPEDLYDANSDGVTNSADGTNALECDLVAAITRLKSGDVLGSQYNPEFVRPPFWKHGGNVESAYSSSAVRAALGGQSLHMILTDVQGKDTAGTTWSFPLWVRRRLENGMEMFIEDYSMADVVVTLHDSNTETAQNLADPADSYLDMIVEGGREGFGLDTAQQAKDCLRFVGSEEQTRLILRHKVEWPVHPDIPPFTGP